MPCSNLFIDIYQLHKKTTLMGSFFYTLRGVGVLGVYIFKARFLYLYVFFITKEYIKIISRKFTMIINNGDYKKSNQLINRLSYMDEKRDLVSITLNEEKLLEYLFFSLQKRLIIRKDIKQSSFYWNKNEWGEALRLKTANEDIESVQFEIELYSLKKFM